MKPNKIVSGIFVSSSCLKGNTRTLHSSKNTHELDYQVNFQKKSFVAKKKSDSWHRKNKLKHPEIEGREAGEI